MLANLVKKFTFPRVKFKASLNDDEFRALKDRLQLLETRVQVTESRPEVEQLKTARQLQIVPKINEENKFLLSFSWPQKNTLNTYLNSFKSANNELKKEELNKPLTVILTKEAIDQRTVELVSNLKIHASTDPGHVRRLEDLCQHLYEYPEALGLAIKYGAIGQILSILRQNPDHFATQLQAKEALAILGHTGPLRGKGIRILSIDGGGMRGIIGLQMLKQLEKETGQKIHQLFDFIVGVSTGAIIASFLGFHKKSISEVETTYKEIGSRIFTQGQFDGYRGWVLSHSFYNTKLYEDILKGFVGEFPMNGLNRTFHSTPNVAIIASHVTEQRITPYVFRSYNLPFLVRSSFKGACHYPVWAAVRASSAAPGYFDEFSLDNNIFHDGGILVNNATHIGIHEARRLWPHEKLHCVVSLGLGRHELPLETNENMSKPLSIHQKFARIVDSATDTELVHETLNDNLEKNVYYRFNPYLPEYLPLDEKRPEKMALMAEAADMYLRRNRKKLLEACKRLTQPRSYLDLSFDYLTNQREMRKKPYIPIDSE